MLKLAMQRAKMDMGVQKSGSLWEEGSENPAYSLVTERYFAAVVFRV